MILTYQQLDLIREHVGPHAFALATQVLHRQQLREHRAALENALMYGYFSRVYGRGR